MTGYASGLVLGFLLATAYGAAFHLLIGGPARHILLYVVAAWAGFGLGHLLGDFLEVGILDLGAVHLFTASLGAWIALVGCWLFVRVEQR